VARDHNYNDVNFNNVAENAKILARVIGIRFELNDPYVSVIAKLAQEHRVRENRGGNPKISVFDDVALEYEE
jgi:hypothetical protein